jgi:heat-inducible transcriptional repressor
MKKATNLNARTEQILCSIVKAYIETGEPVASLDISRLRRHHASSATIRSVMADLASEGYLHQPHTSAGRVPTGKAFQVFIGNLPGKRMLETEFGRIHGALGQASSVEQRVECCSHLLTEMTNGIGIAAAIPAAAQILDQVQLISLGDRRVLMVVVTRDKLVRDSVVTLDEAISQDELTSIRNYINMNFEGWALSEIQTELRGRLARTSAAYDLVLKKLILLYQKGLLDFGYEPELRMDGQANLVAFELHLTKERLKELFHALEEKKRVLQLLERFLDEKPSGEVGVRVGLAEEHPSMEELSLIGISVPMQGGMSGCIAVLGPLRMDYERAMSAVLHVGHALARAGL